MKIIKKDSTIEELVIEVMKNVRCQKYTSEKLCDLQNIIDTQFFYYWSMDMKKKNMLVIYLQMILFTVAFQRLQLNQNLRLSVQSL